MKETWWKDVCRC